jgi:outer membrane receptor for Fe3+-dicitrate
VRISNSIKSFNQLATIDLKTNPVNSSQEILRKVPGLFIGQHAGGGKAEQLFLRGFDIDHGTDIAISVDGMPVNMVSHAHGQGYADLHFLIPETIKRLDFGKGPYYANKGNFNTAGYVDFQTKESIEQSSMGLEIGQFNSQRAIALIDLLKKKKDQHAYFAGEYIRSDGPFDSPQDFQRLNLMTKYTYNLANDDKFSFLASHFNSQWDASGQIPQRAVDSGLITRFGAIDDTEGGETSRTNIAFNYTKNLDDQSFIKNKLYYSQYNFELFSNFTFFLVDPINSDQIKQKENRHLFGGESVWHKNSFTGFGNIAYQVGLSFRQDYVNNLGLWRTINRTRISSTLAEGAVKESNIATFASAAINFDKFQINPGLRIDYFNFNYDNELSSANPEDSKKDAIISPKLNLIYNPNSQLQLFFKSGMGFHSNDSRVVIAQDARETLPAAYGADIGASWKPQAKLWLNMALWYLHLQQEFVYVGDEGIVEPSGKTRRLGIDLGVRWQLNPYLFFDTDFNYTLARAIEEPKDSDLIPLAPELTMTGGLNLQTPNGWSGGIHYRFIKDRPATEDNSIVAEGYFITDMNVEYSFGKISLGVSAENIFNTDWNEAQFATESRLKDELEPVEELHYTPGTPFNFRAKVVYRF